MRTQLLALTMGLMVASCATAPRPEPPPDVPVQDLHAKVLQSDRDWAWFISVQTPSKTDAAAVQSTRNAYTEAVKSGDTQRIRKSATNYIGLVNELMVPLMVPAPKKK